MENSSVSRTRLLSSAGERHKVADGNRAVIKERNSNVLYSDYFHFAAESESRLTALMKRWKSRK